MKPISETLEIIRLALETDIPALLTAAGLTDFEVYKIGDSKNAKQIGLFVQHNLSKKKTEPEFIDVIVQLQLYNIDDNAYLYADIVSEYLEDFEPNNIECDQLEEIEINSWPMDRTSTSFEYIMCKWTSEIDSCDIT